MRRTLYLHIGTFKTGTSSIQNFLADHAEELKKLNFFVPYGELRYQHALPLSLIIDHTKFRSSWEKVANSSDYYWALLKKQLEENNYPNIIISSEFFCDFLHPLALAKKHLFRQILKESFAEFEVKVIIYLRNIADYAISMYKEIVKGG